MTKGNEEKFMVDRCIVWRPRKLRGLGNEDVVIVACAPNKAGHVG